MSSADLAAQSALERVERLEKRVARLENEESDMDDCPREGALEWCRENDARIEFCHLDPNTPVRVMLPPAPTGVSPTGYGKSIEEAVCYLLNPPPAMTNEETYEARAWNDWMNLSDDEASRDAREVFRWAYRRGRDDA